MRFATGWPSWAGRCATRPRAPRLVPKALSGRQQIIYGKQPVAEAERGRRRVHRVWRAPETSARGAGAALRVARPPGRRRRGRSLSLWRPGGAAAAGGRADRRPRPGPGPAQPRRGLPLGRVRRRGRASSSPSGARRRSPRSPARPRRARSSTSQIAHVRNLADWLGEAKEAGFWIWGADAERRAGALGRRPERPDRARPGRRGQGPAAPRRLRLRRPRRPAAARARSTRSTSPPPPRRCSSRPSASALSQHCNGGCTKSQFGVDRTPRSRKLPRQQG